MACQDCERIRAAIREWHEARRAVSQEQSRLPYTPGAGPGRPSDMRKARATDALDRIAREPLSNPPNDQQEVKP